MFKNVNIVESDYCQVLINSGDEFANDVDVTEGAEIIPNILAACKMYAYAAELAVRQLRKYEHDAVERVKNAE